jgi:ubiquinone/menaquinone biosynthesis C-methylase UbiE
VAVGLDTAPGAWRQDILEVNAPADRVPRMYSRLAPVYELWARATESRARLRVLELTGLSGDDDVLEVATGTGAQLVRLAAASHGRTVGVELADGMLARTRARLDAAGLAERVELLLANALELPLEDESFDVVVNSYMLDLLSREDIPRALTEFKRVLRPGGRLVLSNMTKAERRRHCFWDAAYARGVQLTANCRGVLAAPVLAELGFIEIKREYLAQMLFPTEIVTARKEES